MKIEILLFLLTFSAIARAEAGLDQETLNQSLRQSAIAGAIPRIEKLIEQGADVNSPALYGETALDYAIRFSRHKAAMRLIELGANPNIEDNSGITPLYRAAGDCNASKVVDTLLKAGADFAHTDLYGRNPLMSAVHSDCTQNVALILLKGRNKIDLDARDNELETVEDLARDGLVSKMLEQMRDYQRGKSGNKLTLIKSLK